MKIAWIGTGVMGAPMAKNLKKAGFNVHVYNRTFSKAKALEEFGIIAHDNLKNCIEDADFIFTIVGYPSDVLEITNEIFKHAKKGAVITDMTTSSPTLAKSLYEKGKELGLNLLDAPVTGGDIGAIKGTLSIMVGGDEDVFNKTLMILSKLGSTINYIGKSGSGQHAKLANQAAIAGSLAGLAESLAYAKEKGLDLNKMLSVLTNGSASSWQALNNGPKMINKNYNPGFYIKHFLKDLNLIIEEAKSFDPVIVKRVRDVYDLLLSKELGDLGTQAIIINYL